MKATGLFAVLCAVLVGTAHAQWQDDFSDGDFLANPTWLGNTNVYSVNNGVLELDNPAPDTQTPNMSSIYTESAFSSLNNCEWRFSIDHGFDGSASNQSRVYLLSNNPATSFSGIGSSGVVGYYLLFGEANSADVIRFYYDDGASVALLASGTTSLVGSFQASVRVRRSAAAEWTLEADFSGGQDYSLEAAFIENTLASSAYFGVINKYTSSNANNFAFDNFYAGEIEVDTTPPCALYCSPMRFKLPISRMMTSMLLRTC